jgi:predicted nucleic acid-binding protein
MATMADDGTYIDTNILVYSTDSFSPYFHIANRALQRVIDHNGPGVISPQVGTEYLSVSLRSSLTTGTPSPATVLRNVETFSQRFRMVDENAAVVKELLNLLQTYPTAGRRVHDANIVATMLAHGVRRLLTNNVDDFARFASVITIVPLA